MSSPNQSRTRSIVAAATAWVTPRGQIAELSGSMALSAVLALFLGILYAALAPAASSTEIGSLFFLTVAICWACGFRR